MRNKLITVVRIICLLVAIGCIAYLGNYLYQNYKSQKTVGNLKELIKKSEDDYDNSSGYTFIDGMNIQNKYVELYKENSDFIGWLNIKDTNIDYPVMQNISENEYYLRKDFYKKYSLSGTPFMDNRCSIKPSTSNLMIYGHNMKTGYMFANLLKYKDQDFYDEHKEITFNTIFEDRTYEVVAAFYSQIYDENKDVFKYYQFFDAASQEDFEYYVDNIKKLSSISTDVDVEYGDELLTLSTCAYHTTDGRFVVVAKRVK